MLRRGLDNKKSPEIIPPGYGGINSKLPIRYLWKCFARQYKVEVMTTHCEAVA